MASPGLFAVGFDVLLVLMGAMVVVAYVCLLLLEVEVCEYSSCKVDLCSVPTL